MKIVGYTKSAVRAEKGPMTVRVGSDHSGQELDADERKVISMIPLC